MTIFLLEKNGDLSIYETVEEAESSMESPDIEAGEYARAFDADGNIYAISTEGTIHESRWTLIPAPGILTLTNKNAALELHSLLKPWWPSAHPDNPTLQDLVACAIETLTEYNSHRKFPQSMLPSPQ